MLLAAKKTVKQYKREAKSATLAAKAREIRTTEPEVAFNLTIVAYRRIPTEVSSKIFHNMCNDHQLSFFGKTLYEQDDEVANVVFLLYGRTFLTRSFDHTVKLWRNFHGEWVTGTLWNRIRQLPAEQQAECNIDWKY